MEDDLLTDEQAAQIAGVLRQTITRARKEGRLPFTVKYGRRLIKPGDLEIYIQSLGQRNGHLAKTGQQEPKRRRSSQAGSQA